MKLHTYLNYGGNCAEAFRFYEKNLGGEILAMMTYADQPDPKNVPPGTEKWILNANMAIGETQLMGSDVPAERFSPYAASIFPSPSIAAKKPNASSNC
jgi:PhnB protein